MRNSIINQCLPVNRDEPLNVSECHRGQVDPCWLACDELMQGVHGVRKLTRVERAHVLPYDAHVLHHLGRLRTAYLRVVRVAVHLSASRGLSQRLLAGLRRLLELRWLRQVLICVKNSWVRQAVHVHGRWHHM